MLQQPAVPARPPACWHPTICHLITNLITLPSTLVWHADDHPVRGQRTLLALADAARGVQPAAIEVPLALAAMGSDSKRRHHAQLVAAHIHRLRSPLPNSAEAVFMDALAAADDDCSEGDWEEQYPRWAGQRIAAARAAAKTLATHKPLLDAFERVWRSVAARRSGPGPGSGVVEQLGRVTVDPITREESTPRQQGSECELLP